MKIVHLCKIRFLYASQMQTDIDMHAMKWDPSLSLWAEYVLNVQSIDILQQ